MSIMGQIRAFKKDCFDFVGRVVLTDSGYVLSEEKLLSLAAHAKQQLCRIVGCSPPFLDLLSDEGSASLCNAFLERDFLVRCRGSVVRAILPACSRVDYEFVAERVTRLNLKLQYLGDDFMVLVSAGSPFVVILSSETGYCSVSFLLGLRLGSGQVLKKVRFKLKDNTSLSDLSHEFDLLKTAIPVLESSVRSLFIKFRRIDLKSLPYPSSVKDCLVGPIESEAVISYKDLIKNALKIKSIRDWLVTQCDLFDIGVNTSKYIKDGYLIRWPMRSNWLRG